ncbi:hypothetical protein AV955_gp068 [Diadromus pulchellus ascovirus 4a]|uniref:Complete DpAV4 genome n=1 Tax=Diadromus pulchellus ascovirus 4a TaxID=158683 RepID=F2NYZ7_9VIRU|nr:hypothetical protein AV955_gp068 [Diadromus pulchellus ascovirus 4a]CCA61425.1 unnamed protein product [Diadromus pulchellus ascovirus 4a]
MDCPICCEKFTSGKRRRTPMPCCERAACSACLEKYLVDGDGRPQRACPFCDAHITTEFIRASCSKKFLNDYFVATAEDIMKREDHMMRAMRERIVCETNIEELQYLGSVLAQRIRDRADHPLAEFAALCDAKLSVFEIRNATISERIQECWAEGCEGRLMDSVCQTCNTTFCVECRLPRGESHKCDSDSLKSIAAIKKETRACPTCATPIFKIEGCNQMFCTKCHTGFCWRTGSKITGEIHNPHYFEWLASRGRQMENESDDEETAALRRHIQNNQAFDRRTIDRRYTRQFYMQRLGEINNMIFELTLQTRDPANFENEKDRLRRSIVLTGADSKVHRNRLVLLLKGLDMKRDIVTTLHRFKTEFGRVVTSYNGDTLEHLFKYAEIVQAFNDDIKALKMKHGISPGISITNQWTFETRLI